MALEYNSDKFLLTSTIKDKYYIYKVNLLLLFIVTNICHDRLRDIYTSTGSLILSRVIICKQLDDCLKF